MQRIRDQILFIEGKRISEQTNNLLKVHEDGKFVRQCMSLNKYFSKELIKNP